MTDRVRDCDNNHHYCADARGDAFIPELLVEVIQQPPRLVRQIDLQRGFSHSARVRYAALSYCWGPPSDSESQAKTLTATLPQMFSGLQDSEMTAILGDAIRVTRALSIPYLWIDALCIVQDNIAD